MFEYSPKKHGKKLHVFEMKHCSKLHCDGKDGKKLHVFEMKHCSKLHYDGKDGKKFLVFEMKYCAKLHFMVLSLSLFFICSQLLINFEARILIKLFL